MPDVELPEDSGKIAVADTVRGFIVGEVDDLGDLINTADIGLLRTGMKLALRDDNYGDLTSRQRLSIVNRGIYARPKPKKPKATPKKKAASA